MNETMYKGASNNTGYDNTIGNLYRSPNNMKRGFSPSIYERALTKEFLNDNMNQTSIPEDRFTAKLSSPEPSFYNRNIAPTPSKKENIEQQRMSYSPSPIYSDIKHEYTDPSAYSNYMRDLEERRSRTNTIEGNSYINNIKKPLPATSSSQIIPSKSNYQNTQVQNQAKKFIIDESVYDQKPIKYYAPNKGAYQLASNEKNPKLSNSYERSHKKSADISEILDRSNNYEQDIKQKYNNSQVPWYKEERMSIPRMSKSNVIQDIEYSKPGIPSTLQIYPTNPYEGRIEHEGHSKTPSTVLDITKDSGCSTPTKINFQKQTIRYLNITEIGELVAAKEKNSQMNVDLASSQFMRESQIIAQSKPTKQKSKPAEIIKKVEEPKPTSFVAKIDPISFNITTMNIPSRSRTPEKTQEPRRNKENREDVQNPRGRLEIKTLQSRTDGRLSPMQAKEIYSKIINKSPVVSSHPLKERVISPNESMHGEGKINQLNSNISKSRYNFAEEGENVNSLKHSKSVSKYSSKKNDAPSKGLVEVVPIIGTKKSSENRSSSEEKYSKPILQSLQDISNNILQSTKTLFNKFMVPKPRTKCDCSPYLTTNQETCPRAQKWLYTKYKMTELDYLRKTYDKIMAEETEAKSKKQIKLDLMRTYPDCKVFANSSEGIQSLEKVLECYSKYDPQIGYVQGINFIVASILFHAEEYIAFWILILIFEKCEMRDIFMNNLPGLTKHSQIIDFLILNNLPDLYSHFCKNNIVVEMFCTEWLCGLFGSVIPIEKMGLFLDGFIEHGWPYFYKFVLTLLSTCEKELRRAQDMSEIMLLFKNGINKNNNGSGEGSLRINWEQVIKQATKMEIDSSFIYNLHTNFDQNRKTFNLPNSKN